MKPINVQINVQRLSAEVAFADFGESARKQEANQITALGMTPVRR
jgi:hypothetical protein